MKPVHKLHKIKMLLIDTHMELMSIGGIKGCEIIINRLETDLTSAIVCVETIIKKEDSSNQDKSSPI